jgi:hypothetical protein
LPGGAFTHWESAAFSRRTPSPVIGCPRKSTFERPLCRLPISDRRSLARAGLAISRHSRSRFHGDQKSGFADQDSAVQSPADESWRGFLFSENDTLRAD